MQISKKVYSRFIKRYQYPILKSVPVLGYNVSGMLYLNNNNKTVISCLYEKINGKIIKSFYYNKSK